MGPNRGVLVTDLIVDVAVPIERIASGLTGPIVGDCIERGHDDFSVP